MNPNRQNVHRLNISMPSVFVGVHDVKPATGVSPGLPGVLPLIQKSWPTKGLTDTVVVHTRPMVLDGLGKDMQLVSGG